MESKILYNRRFVARTVFLAAIVAWVWRYQNGILLHQIGVPVLQNPSIDYAYWAWSYSGIAHQIMAQNWGFWIDLGWLSAAIGMVIYYRNNVLPVLFWVCAVAYHLTLNLYDCWMNAFFLGFLLVPIPFFTKKTPLFSLLMEGLRYYVVFIYFSAFLWKVFGLFFLNIEEGQAVISQSLGFWLYERPHDFSTQIYTFFINHPQLSYAMFLLGAISQAFFVVGFFTKKYDKILVFLAVSFHILAYYFIDVPFFELLVLQIVFLNKEKQ
ncbi:MAG: hypothetical protein RI894_1799 [Bacteroidota bacterium]